MPRSRPSSSALDARLFETIPCLDHGFVRLIDYMGDDSAVVQAARVSYGSGTKTVREDRGLIRYLMRHRHTTPFEMCELKLHIKLPIFVARQWVRHRTASLNEISGRYSVLERELYVPSSQDLARQSRNNKQGRGESLDELESQKVLEILKLDGARSFDTYDELLEKDLAREISRITLPLSTYTQWYWKIDLHNLLHFLSLRVHPHAQKEIRAYANIIADLVKIWVPHSWEAFEDYRLNSATLSGQEVEAARELMRGAKPSYTGMSKREITAFKALFGVE